MNYTNERKYLLKASRLLVSLILIFSFSIVGISQKVNSQESYAVDVPEQAMERVVPRVLIWYFKVSDNPKVIYLAEQGIRRSWLPSIKNIEFRLLSSEEVQQREKGVYLFTKVEKHSPNTFEIVFAFGNPDCEYAGDRWHFLISKHRVRLWKRGEVFMGCSPPFSMSNRNLTTACTRPAIACMPSARLKGYTVSNVRAGDAGRYAAEVMFMPFYTFIMEYAGGTYISQVKASSPKSACVKAAQSLDASQVSGLGPRSKESLIEQMKEDAPVPLSGLLNAWCKSALIRGEYALINLVQTEQPKNNRGGVSDGRASA